MISLKVLPSKLLRPKILSQFYPKHLLFVEHKNSARVLLTYSKISLTFQVLPGILEYSSILVDGFSMLGLNKEIISTK